MLVCWLNIVTIIYVTCVLTIYRDAVVYCRFNTKIIALWRWFSRKHLLNSWAMVVVMVGVWMFLEKTTSYLSLSLSSLSLLTRCVVLVYLNYVRFDLGHNHVLLFVLYVIWALELLKMMSAVIVYCSVIVRAVFYSILGSNLAMKCATIFCSNKFYWWNYFILTD